MWSREDVFGQIKASIWKEFQKAKGTAKQTLGPEFKPQYYQKIINKHRNLARMQADYTKSLSEGMNK
jgi:hypothetical protein